MQKSQDKGVWGDLRPSDHNPTVETVLAKGYVRHLIAAHRNESNGAGVVFSPATSVLRGRGRGDGPHRHSPNLAKY